MSLTIRDRDYRVMAYWAVPCMDHQPAPKQRKTEIECGNCADSGAAIPSHVRASFGRPNSDELICFGTGHEQLQAVLGRAVATYSDPQILNGYWFIEHHCPLTATWKWESDIDSRRIAQLKKHYMRDRERDNRLALPFEDAA